MTPVDTKQRPTPAEVSVTAAGRPRVTYLITSSSVAGAQRQAHDLALALVPRGWAPAIISMLPRDAAFDDLPEQGIPFESLDMTRGIPDPRALWRLRALLKELRPDVLHGHMVHANLLARLSRLLVRTPVVISTMHNENEGAQWRYYAYRLTDRLGDLTTNVSVRAVEESIRRHAVARGRIVLMPNGLEPRAFTRDPERRQRTRASLGVDDEFLWLAVGRIEGAKDYPNMIDAFTQVQQTDATTRLVIAGTGDQAPDVQAAIDAAGLGSKVTLLGLRSDVPALMEAADGFVMSSAWEGLPMVLLEAGMSALPAVVTDVGGSRDAVIDGTSGFIVPARDVGALAAAMTRLMSRSPDERRSMGEAARTHVTTTFAMDAIADRWDETYRRLLAHHEGR
jgi:glycosyltransferase involved in cell wall biosynthesis